MKITLFFTTFLISAFSYSQELKTVKTSDYEISYPTKLRFDDSKIYNSEFVILTEKEGENDEFIENINLLIQNLKGYKIDLNQYVKISEGQVNKNGELIESKRVNLNNSEIHILNYKANLNGNDLKFYQYLLIKNEKAFVLTYTAEIDKFDIFFPEIIKIFNSFSLK
jgi:hypothetical protein